jgi:hypothetical protein
MSLVLFSNLSPHFILVIMLYDREFAEFFFYNFPCSFNLVRRGVNIVFLPDLLLSLACCNIFYNDTLSIIFVISI